VVNKKVLTELPEGGCRNIMNERKERELWQKRRELVNGEREMIFCEKCEKAHETGECLTKDENDPPPLINMKWSIKPRDVVSAGPPQFSDGTDLIRLLEGQEKLIDPGGSTALPK
jgi:hypothetical protein